MRAETGLKELVVEVRIITTERRPPFEHARDDDPKSIEDGEAHYKECGCKLTSCDYGKRTQHKTEEHTAGVTHKYFGAGEIKK